MSPKPLPLPLPLLLGASTLAVSSCCALFSFLILLHTVLWLGQSAVWHLASQYATDPQPKHFFSAKSSRPQQPHRFTLSSSSSFPCFCFCADEEEDMALK
jgi:hypothetical protein